MYETKIHFRRTLAALSALKVDFRFLSEDINGFDNELNEFLQGTSITQSQNLDLLNEIKTIEKDKRRLRSSKNEISGIFEKELIIYKQREIFMNNFLEDFFDEKFIINPALNVRVSQRNWSDIELEISPELYNGLIKAKTYKNYFGLLKTGIYDEIFDTNIIEFPLTVYQYFLLLTFRSPITLKAAIKSFEDKFKVISEKEVEQLNNISKNLIRELLFKTLIIII